MSGNLAVINISQLITINGPRRPRIGAEMSDLAIITEGAMIIRDERIERTGTRYEIEPLLAGHDYKVIDAGGRIVCPASSTHTRIRYSPESASTNTRCARAERPIRKSRQRAEA